MLHSMSRSWGGGSGQTTSSSSSSVTLNRRISLRYAHHSGGTAFSAENSGQLHSSCHFGGKFHRFICIVNRYQSRLFERHFGRCARVLRRNENSMVRTRREGTMPNNSRDKFTKYPWSQFPYLPRQMVSSGISDQCFPWDRRRRQRPDSNRKLTV